MKKSLLLSVFLFIPALACTSPQKKTVTSQDQVKSTVSAILPEVKNCYINGLKEKNDLKGRITTSFQVNAQGKVSKCLIKSSDLQSREVEACVCQKISKTIFPPAPQGKLAKIDYPFVFSTKE
jgi:TonB family protein